MGKQKRGRLRHVEVKPMYDEKGKNSGYTVSAHHEAAPSDSKSDFGGYVSPIESPHENMESAVAKVRQHLSGGETPESDNDADDKPQPMKKAFGRPYRK